jgi:universal stress protein F
MRKQAGGRSATMIGPLREAVAVMKRILVALDGSPRAPRVLEVAARLAELAGGRLVLYRAITVSPELPGEVFIETERRLEDILLANARDDLARTAAQLRPELVERTVTTFAIPWDGICRAARECEADLIAIGSHGYGGIDRILGTTAGKVVNHADRNVLVVRNSL